MIPLARLGRIIMTRNVVGRTPSASVDYYHRYPQSPSHHHPSRDTTKSREKAVLPPAIHSVEWDATTLVDEIRMERSMGRTRQTAAERIKTEWETRPNLLRRRAPLEEDDATTPHSMPHPRPRPLSTPVSPSDDLREHEGSTAPRHQSVPGFDAQVIVSGHVRQPLELKVYSPSEMAAELEMKRAGG
ncbi:hypothetical protein CPB85DRAFT_608136 [Mucidula mucida]|nr:hypothetical protein CPB85DRAFT_608136 [Mucidula mucida]